MTEASGKATIKGVTGYAVLIDLVNYEKEPIKKLSEEELAKRRATLAAKKAAKEASAKTAAEGTSKKAPQESTPATAEPEDEE